jgi:hypothetical protein
MRRPTPEQTANHEAAWAEYQKSSHEETPLIQMLSAGNPNVASMFHDQFVAACFLEDTLNEMGAPSAFVKDACFTFGRFCLGRDAWAAFDLFFPKCEADVKNLTDKKSWAGVAVVQDVPPASDLLNEWWSMAKRARGDRGVFPQMFLLREHSNNVSIHALALNGSAAINSALVTIQVANPAEFVLGIDMSAVPGQGLEFGDFLAVVWYLDGQFYTGVVDYQVSTASPPTGETEPAFRPIRWDNNYWNHSLREKSPIPAMVKALEKANTPRGDA